MTQQSLDFLARDAAISPEVKRTGSRVSGSPGRRKRIQITTLEAWHKLLPTLPERERAVLSALERYYDRRPRKWPTAYELFEFMRKYEQNVFDVNSVRPVLTRLKDKGLVEFGGRCKCTVTEQTAYQWRFPIQTQQLLWENP